MKNIALAIFLILLTSTANYAQTFTKVVDKKPFFSCRSINVYAAPAIGSKGISPISRASELMVKEPYDLPGCKSKIDLVLRNGGIGLIAVGTSMIVGGLVILVTDFPYYKNSNSQSSSSYKTFGAGLFLAGGLFASGGIAMTVIGQRKINASKIRMSFNINPTLVSFACQF
jgi:hypothetical protein